MLNWSRAQGAKLKVHPHALQKCITIYVPESLNLNKKPSRTKKCVNPLPSERHITLIIIQTDVSSIKTTHIQLAQSPVEGCISEGCFFNFYNGRTTQKVLLFHNFFPPLLLCFFLSEGTAVARHLPFFKLGPEIIDAYVLSPYVFYRTLMCIISMWNTFGVCPLRWKDSWKSRWMLPMLKIRVCVAKSWFISRIVWMLNQQSMYSWKFD